jgi:ComF family protein
MNGKQILLLPYRILLSLVKSALNFIYPPYCMVCSSQLAEDEKLICDNCWLHTPRIEQEFDLFNEIKLGDEVYFSKVISAWEFSPTIQTAIHLLKYQNYKVLANRIGLFMAERLTKQSLPMDKTILVPVPLHKTRTRERGYNQSTLLCKIIAVESGLNYSDKILKRTRYTQSQTKLNAIERAKNVENAFKVIYPEQIKNRLVILVDDVITTGSTMNACAKELIKNGANDVYLLSAVKA